MEYRDSIAARCRYGEHAGAVFGQDAEVIFEASTDDYQGSANVLLRMADGRFAHFEWTYGSCSGCDEWEDRGLSDEQIEQVMRDTAVWFDDEETLARYLRAEDPEQPYPRDQSTTAGSIPGMLPVLTGGIGEEFKAMGDAFTAWRTAP
jgi:hypothetical protein